MSARTVNRLRVAVASIVLVTFGVAPVAHADQSVSTSFSMPVGLNGSVTVSDCENSPGPQITLEGVMVLGGVGVQLIFRNQRTDGAPHERVEEVQTVVGVENGQTIVIPKQPSRGGVGGNPWIWVQLVDMNNKPLTGETFLGRCVQGPFPATVDFDQAAIAQALVDVLDCTNNPGPFINVSGSLSLSPGAKARFIFRNQRKAGAPHEADAFVDVTLFPTGFTLKFPKQPVLGGVGGNPWISVQFATATEPPQPIGNEFLLGRCVQLMPGN